MGLPWSSAGVSFLMIILIGTGLTLSQYLLLSLFFQPITLTFWMLTITELLYKDKQKVIVGLYGILGLIYEIYLLYYIINNPLVIGRFVDPPLDMNYVGFTMLYSIFILISVSVSLLLLVKSGLKSEQSELRLKAKFNLLAIISFIIGALLDGSVSVNIVAVFIVRILLIASAIEFYIGWIMPELVKNRFLKTP